MTTVLLQGAEFFAHHGYYPEEQLLGCTFVIDLAVSFTRDNTAAHDDLNGTINYERLFNICCEEMKTPRKLIETVAYAIVDRIKNDYPYITHVQLTLKKMFPPMKGNVKNSGIVVNYYKE
ncbi:dihydroneopterin aldolase [Mucilaginibacter hurinus]|uniref:7,8-dihydroneopterin aldolase n=1 Tax=Mucilaginibacter hurinus TaxID=2201324 RepID=A0A367GRA4_9SPHI|nr:dihydroneopterin aldolase [Mucilaginibacter hurinus]RCH55233.1 dihydroneopterin aldolase [Mucilaginibacter hurinus]